MSDIKIKVFPLFPTKTTAIHGLKFDKTSSKWALSLGFDQLEVRNPYTLEPDQHFAVFDGHGYFRVSTAHGATIVTTPSTLVTSDHASVGALIGTLSVVGGAGSYSFYLSSSAGGDYAILGNQLQVGAPLTAGTDTITIVADNGAGSVLTLTTTVTVNHVTVTYTPTYHIYGF